MATDRSLHIFAYLVHGLLLVVLVDAAFKDFQIGGEEWRQGDWLINNHAAIVRRGVLGSVLIGFSDLVGLPLLQASILVPLAVYLVFFGFLLRLMATAPAGSPLFLLFVSGGFAFLSWGGDPIGSYRKEIIGFVALAWMILAFLRSTPDRVRWAGIAGALAVFAIAAMGHEINTAFAPALALVAFDAHARGLISGRRFWALAAAIGAVAGAAAAYALAFRAGDPAQVCAPLLARGIEPHLCDGAIAWLGLTLADISAGADIYLKPGRLLGFAASVVLICLPIGLFIRACGNRGPVLGAAAISILSFAPFFFVAFDWGRWVTLQISCFVLLAIYLAGTGRVSVRGQISSRVFGCFIILGLIAPPDHVIGLAHADIVQDLVAVVFGAGPGPKSGLP